MKKIIATALFIFVLVSGVSAQGIKEHSTTSGYKTYDLNFKNVSMKEFVLFVSSFANMNIVYNESDLVGSVTIASTYPLKSNDIMEIFYATLASSSLILVQEDDYYRVIPQKEIAIYDDKFELGDNISSGSLVTTIIVLNNYNANSLASILSRMKSPSFGHIEPIRGVNAILIKDYGSKVDKMREIASYLDSQTNDFQLYSIPLTNILATKMEQQLSKLFNELVRNSLSSHVPIMVSDDISNTLLVVTDRSSFKKIDYVVKNLDVVGLNSGNAPKIFYLKYANAADVEAVLNKLFTSNNNGQTTSKLSVSSDKSTNSIIALGSYDYYANLESTIHKLDIPRRQVYVEALILETSLDRGDRFGVEWFGGSKVGDNLLLIGDKNRGDLDSIMNPSNKNPVGSLPGGFSTGFIGNVINFNGVKIPSLGVFLNAVRSDTGVNIVSNPQILTLDNEEATVFVGENRPYVVSEKFDNNNNPIKTYDYRDVGIKLKVIPHIAGDESILLEIDQEVNKATPGTDASTAPVTLTRSTKTKVKLNNGSIMYISGLMKDDSYSDKREVPLLSDIPLLGWLFKSTGETYEKTNLMIFITAHIIDTIEDMNSLTTKKQMTGIKFNNEISDMMSDDFGTTNNYINIENN